MIMILPIWQDIGSSTHQLAAQLARELAEPVTHTGTLDPVAEGVVVLLTGDDRFVKGYLPSWKKTYSFEILWGISSDSGDKLGLVTEKSNYTPRNDLLTTVLTRFPKEYNQMIPAFSAKRIGGTSSFMHARNGTAMPQTTRQVLLSQISYDQKKYLSGQEVLALQKSEIEKVIGDFRQEDVLESWQSRIQNDQEQFLITAHTVTTSAGTYIRQLVTDIAEKLAVPATTWKITRTQNGPFTKDDCTENA